MAHQIDGSEIAVAPLGQFPRLRRVAVPTVVLALAWAGTALADVTGTVRTPAGVPIPGAAVVATDAAGGVAGRSTLSDANGAYRITLAPGVSDPPPFTLKASVRGACRTDVTEVQSAPVPDGAVQDLTLDAPLFCGAMYVSASLPPATGFAWPERGQVLAPSGGVAYLRVLAPSRASGFVLALADGTVLGASETATSIPLTAPAAYEGPLMLSYASDGVAVTRQLATLIAGGAPAATRPSGPFDLATIVDVSGSMAQADPSYRRTDALQLLIDLAGEGDRLAAVGFDSGLRDIFGRTTISGAASQSALKRLARARIGNFGGTDYQVGFSNAFDALSAEPLDAATPKGAIFLTDGAHQGAYDNSHLKFAFNGTGHTWPVCVVQLGTSFSATDTARLKRIASDTGGSFVETPTNTELEDLYFQCQGRATGAKTLLRKVGTFRVGQTRRYVRKVTRRQRKATFFVSYGAGRYQLRLKQPGGRVYRRSAGKRVRLVRGKTFSFFEVQRPKAGSWTLGVKRLRTGGKLDRATTTITVQRKVTRPR